MTLTVTRPKRRIRAPQTALGIWAEAKLVNWGRWARGYPGSIGYPCLSFEEQGLEPNEEDAQAVEEVMVRCKNGRSRDLWPIALGRYVYRNEDATIAMSERISDTVYRMRVQQLYVYLDAGMGW